MGVDFLDAVDLENGPYAFAIFEPRLAFQTKIEGLWLIESNLEKIQSFGTKTNSKKVVVFRNLARTSTVSYLELSMA